MTATDELRKLLDERGVKWREGSPNKTKWSHDGIEFVAVNAWPRNGGKTRLILCANITPEQAIEATLGNEESYTRDDVESAFVSGYSLGCLPVGSDPQWDQNEQTVDEHMAELGWVRAELLPDMLARVVE